MGLESEHRRVADPHLEALEREVELLRGEVRTVALSVKQLVTMWEASKGFLWFIKIVFGIGAYIVAILTFIYTKGHN